MEAASTGLPDAQTLGALSDAFAAGGPYFLGFVLLAFALLAWRSRLRGALPVAIGALTLSASVFLFALLVWERDRVAPRGLLVEAHAEAQAIRAAAEAVARQSREEAQRVRIEADRQARAAREQAEAEANALRREAQAVLDRAQAATNSEYVSVFQIFLSTDQISFLDVLPPALTDSYRIFWRLVPTAANSARVEILLAGKVPLVLDRLGFLYMKVVDAASDEAVTLPFCAGLLTQADYIQLTRRPEAPGSSVMRPRIEGRRGPNEVDGGCL